MVSSHARALAAAVGLSLAACGPPGPAIDEVGSGESDAGEGEEPPARVAEFAPGGCDGVGSALPLPGGGFVVVGVSAVINGWIARFDDELTLVWEAQSTLAYADVGLGLDDSLWVAAGGWGQRATIERYDLEGSPLPELPALALPDQLELDALARHGDRWVLGGRTGEQFPFDAWLAEIDEQGATTTIHEAPTGNGNVSASIGSIDAAPGLAAACGVASGGEWGWPWLLLLSTALDGPLELTGATPELGVRSCADVAVRENRVARAEGSDPDLIVMLDAAGTELWQREGPGRIRALAFASDGALLDASDTRLRARSPEGDELWSVALGVDELRVRDLVVLADGAIVVAGDTPGEVGECSEIWLGLYR